MNECMWESKNEWEGWTDVCLVKLEWHVRCSDSGHIAVEQSRFSYWIENAFFLFNMLVFVHEFIFTFFFVSISIIFWWNVFIIEIGNRIIGRTKTQTGATKRTKPPSEWRRTIVTGTSSSWTLLTGNFQYLADFIKRTLKSVGRSICNTGMPHTIPRSATNRDGVGVWLSYCSSFWFCVINNCNNKWLWQFNFNLFTI